MFTGRPACSPLTTWKFEHHQRFPTSAPQGKRSGRCQTLDNERGVLVMETKFQNCGKFPKLRTGACSQDITYVEPVKFGRGSPTFRVHNLQPGGNSVLSTYNFFAGCRIQAPGRPNDVERGENGQTYLLDPVQRQ